MYTNRFFLGLAVLLIIVATISESSAQRAGNTGSTGNTGNRGTGNTGSSLVSDSYTQNFSLDSTLSTNSGNGGFIGANNTDFIGATGTTGAANRGAANTRMTATRANTNTANRMGGQGGGTAINTQRQVQPVYMLGFAAPVPNYGLVSSALSQRMDYTVKTGRLATMQFELAEGIVVVRGDVASEHDKKVAENMILLQPGVSEIQSDIQIDTSAIGTNRLSTASRGNPQPAETSATTTSQSQALVHVFESSRNRQPVEIPATTTPQGRPLVYVF